MLTPVSYTHLDVYKRQEIDEVNTGYKVSNISRDADGVIARIIADSYDGRWPVSYTHLDVYKRQKFC